MSGSKKNGFGMKRCVAHEKDVTDDDKADITTLITVRNPQQLQFHGFPFFSKVPNRPQRNPASAGPDVKRSHPRLSHKGEVNGQWLDIGTY